MKIPMRKALAMPLPHPRGPWLHPLSLEPGPKQESHSYLGPGGVWNPPEPACCQLGPVPTSRVGLLRFEMLKQKQET